MGIVDWTREVCEKHGKKIISDLGRTLSSAPLLSLVCIKYPVGWVPAEPQLSVENKI